MKSEMRPRALPLLVRLGDSLKNRGPATRPGQTPAEVAPILTVTREKAEATDEE